MDNREEMLSYLTDNNSRFMVYLINKKRGADGLTLEHDEAVEVLNNALHYYLEHPHNFSKDYIWNKLKQLRIDFIRTRERERDAYEQYAYLFYTEPDDNTISIEEEEIASKIRRDINSARKSSQPILESHFLNNIPMSQDRREQSIIYRFRQKMIAKYGD